MCRIILLLIFIFSGQFTNAQCVSGDCINGSGKYDFGFATYTGSFKNGKPNGQGIMDYGGGDKFEGNFTDGQEDGEGILYKKNVAANVTYVKGKIKVKPTESVIGGNAPFNKDCLQGDCYNGFGIIKFESGNSYAGNFKFGNKDGQGKFTFADGNTFEGTFVNDIYTIGAFFYKNENVTFKGNFNKNGEPNTGEYYYPNNDATVTVKNGITVKINNPVAARADSMARAQAIENNKPLGPCPGCNGKGISGYSAATYSYTYQVGNNSYVTNTRQGKSFPVICSACGGSGKAKRKL